MSVKEGSMSALASLEAGQGNSQERSKPFCLLVEKNRS